MIERLQALIRYFLGKTVFRYIISGGLTAVVNFGSFMIFLYVFGWAYLSGTFLLGFAPATWIMQVLKMGETELIINIAHAISTELSFLFAFHAHNWFTWQSAGHGSYWKKIFNFHLTTGTTFILRQVGFFFLLKWGLHEILALFFPLVIAIMINFVVYNFFIFKKQEEEPTDETPAA